VDLQWRAAGRTLRRGARSVLSPTGLRGTAVEVAWTATHLALYPWGVIEDRARAEADRYTLADLPPIQRGLVVGGVEAAGTPILLVHGMVDNRSIFALLRRGLRRRGFGRVLALNYSPFSDDVREVAERLAALVESLCEDTGYERVHVIGHSMGGLVGRYYVQRLGGDERVHTLVTLGTPHEGTRAASLLPHPLARQLRPDSDIVAELAQPAPGCRTRVVAFWSDLDQLISPKQNARVEHPDLLARNVFVRGVGHMSLPVDGRVVHEICTTLAELDPEGATVVPGVTRLDAGAAPAARKRTTKSRSLRASRRGRSAAADA
jgi:triacylglycerol lipase